jgi:hypothetical protein
MRRRQDAGRDTLNPEDPATASPSQDFSIDYELLEEDGILIVRLAGRVSLERLKMVGPMVRAHPGFDYRIGLIHELSLADPEGIGGDDLVGLVAIMRRRNAPRGHRVAYVLPSDLAWELGQRFKCLVEGVLDRRRYLTRSLDEALAWMRATPH